MSGVTRIDLARSLRAEIDESDDLALQVAAVRPEVPAQAGQCVCGAPIEPDALSAFCAPCRRDLRGEP